MFQSQADHREWEEQLISSNRHFSCIALEPRSELVLMDVYKTAWAEFVVEISFQELLWHCFKHCQVHTIFKSIWMCCLKINEQYHTDNVNIFVNVNLVSLDEH